MNADLVLVNGGGRIDPDAIYTVAQAAVLASMHPETLREKLRARILNGKRKGGGSYRIRGSELLKLA